MRDLKDLSSWIVFTVVSRLLVRSFRRRVETVRDDTRERRPTTRRQTPSTPSTRPTPHFANS